MSAEPSNRELAARFALHEEFDNDRFGGLREDIKEVKIQIATASGLAREDTASIRNVILCSAGAIILFLLGLFATLISKGAHP